MRCRLSVPDRQRPGRVGAPLAEASLVGELRSVMTGGVYRKFFIGRWSFVGAVRYRELHQAMKKRGGMRVIVIGAGLAGLTLAQGLRRAGIDVVVYERDGYGGRPQGISLHFDDRG